MSFDLLISLYGSIVGFVVGLVGGGGSVLGVPILTYFAGVSSTHIAIGTSAVTVGVSASLNLILHSRARNVDWRIAYMFSASGVLGVMLGNQLGLLIASQKLILFFGLFMILISMLMFQRTFFRSKSLPVVTNEDAKIFSRRVVVIGFASGVIAGFFGIGGGVLVVPALVAAVGMAPIVAIGTSLVSILSFSIITIVTYSYHSLIDWNLAASYTIGALFGTVAGSILCSFLSRFRYVLSAILASIIGGVGVFILVRTST